MKDFMKVFEEFGTMKEKDPASEDVQEQVKKLQSFITDHFKIVPMRFSLVLAGCMPVAVNSQRTLTRWVEPERPNLPIRRLRSIAIDEPNYETP